MWMSDFLLARLCKPVTKSCVLNKNNERVTLFAQWLQCRVQQAWHSVLEMPLLVPYFSHTRVHVESSSALEFK